MSFSALMWQFVSTFSDEIELQLVWDLKFKMLSTMRGQKLLEKWIHMKKFVDRVMPPLCFLYSEKRLETQNQL